jgi:hypothetical protein
LGVSTFILRGFWADLTQIYPINSDTKICVLHKKNLLKTHILHAAIFLGYNKPQFIRVIFKFLTIFYFNFQEKTPYYLLLSDVLSYLGQGRDHFLKSHPGAETVELNSNDFLEEAHCCHLLGERFNLNSCSSHLLTLIKYDDRVKKMLNIESCFIR